MFNVNCVGTSSFLVSCGTQLSKGVSKCRDSERASVHHLLKSRSKLNVLAPFFYPLLFSNFPSTPLTWNRVTPRQLENDRWPYFWMRIKPTMWMSSLVSFELFTQQEAGSLSPESVLGCLNWPGAALTLFSFPYHVLLNYFWCWLYGKRAVYVPTNAHLIITWLLYYLNVFYLCYFPAHAREASRFACCP